MKKALGFLALTLGVLPLLSGCATVEAQAQVADDSTAYFALSGSLTTQGYEEYLKALAGNSSTSSDEEKEATRTTSLEGSWKETSGDETITISGTSVVIKDGQGKLLWAGSYIPPKLAVTSYDWKAIMDSSQKDMMSSQESFYVFSYRNGKLIYISKDAYGKSVTHTFTSTTPAAAPTETSTETVPTTTDGLCQAFKEEVAELLALPDPSIITFQCTDDSLSASVTYGVTFDAGGITSVNGEAVDNETAKDLPFGIYKDASYGDIMVSHSILGLTSSSSSAFSTDDWVSAVTAYDLSISFPGEISGYSEGGSQTSSTSVSWDYAAVASAVKDGTLTLRAAGEAKPSLNTTPIYMTIGGLLFLMFLFLYFSWKKFPPKVIAVMGMIFVFFSPLGLCLSFVARKKATNNAEGKALFLVGIFANGAILTFEVIMIILLFILTPDLMMSFLSSVGLVSAA